MRSGFQALPPQVRITMVRNAGRNLDKHPSENTQMTNTTVSDKKVSFWVLNFMAKVKLNARGRLADVKAWLAGDAAFASSRMTVRQPNRSSSCLQRAVMRSILLLKATMD